MEKGRKIMTPLYKSNKDIDKKKGCVMWEKLHTHYIFALLTTVLYVVQLYQSSHFFHFFIHNFKFLQDYARGRKREFEKESYNLRASASRVSKTLKTRKKWKKQAIEYKNARESTREHHFPNGHQNLKNHSVGSPVRGKMG